MSVNSIVEYEAFPTMLYELQFDADLIDRSREELNTFRAIGLPSGVHNYYTSYNNPYRLNVGLATAEILDSITNIVSRHIGKQYVYLLCW